MKYPVGQGWWPLLDEYIPKIEAAGGKLTGAPYEKYGALHIDVSPEPEPVAALLEELEEKSAIICEFCGAQGSEHTLKSEWIKTLCGNCFAERNR